MDALVWDLDGMAGRCYVEMVEHFGNCATCETAGAELARDTSRLCPRPPQAAIRRQPSVESLVRPNISRMVRQGLDDQTIARQLDLAVSTVAAYRQRQGWVYRSGQRVDPNAVATLFRRKLSDQEIAEELGISVVTVRQHRHRLRLLRGPSRG